MRLKLTNGSLRDWENQAYALFVAQLGTTPAWVAAPEATVKGEARWKKDPEGGGPFHFVEAQTRSWLVLAANPDASPRPALDRIEFLIVPNAATALNMYRSGQLDIAPVTGRELPAVLKDPVLSKKLHSWPAAQLVLLGSTQKDARVQRPSRAPGLSSCNRPAGNLQSSFIWLVDTGIGIHSRRHARPRWHKILAYDPERARKLIYLAERVGLASQRFAKLFALKDMPQNAVCTAISVVARLFHSSHKYLLLTTVSRFTVWMVWMRSQQPSESEKRTNA